jgi:hypothetical protein
VFPVVTCPGSARLLSLSLSLSVYYLNDFYSSTKKLHSSWLAGRQGIRQADGEAGRLAIGQVDDQASRQAGRQTIVIAWTDLS